MSLIVAKKPILSILVNTRVELFSFCNPIRCFISSLTMLSLFLRILYFPSSLSLCFFSMLLFSNRLFKESKSLLSSFNFPSNHLFRQSSFYAFGSLLALTNSETSAAAAHIVLFSSVRFRILIFLSTQLTLFTAQFTFACESHVKSLIAPFLSYIQI